MKNLPCALCSLLAAWFVSGNSVSAIQIRRTIVFHQITQFDPGIGIGRMKISANGSKIIFATGDKKVFTVNSDGTRLIQVFDYAAFRTGAPYVTPFIDISADGSRVIWTDGVGEIFVADSDGDNQKRIAQAFAGPDGTVVAPVIVVQPRITADGSAILFANSIPGGGSGGGNSWAPYAGIYRVSVDGSQQTEVVSYSQISQTLFGKDGSEYNPNIAFWGDFDISDDGAKLVFNTKQETGGVVAFDSAGLRLLSADSIRSPAGGDLRLSGDGSTVAFIPDRGGISEGKVIAIDFAGGPERELVSIGVDGQLSLTHSGDRVLAGATGSQSPPIPITLLQADGSGRLDLVLFDFLAQLPSVTADGGRFVFLSPIPSVVGSSEPPQIWVADINPSSLGEAPRIGAVNLSPNFVLADASTTSTFTAAVTPGATPVQSVHFDALQDGAFVNLAVVAPYPGTTLFDDGLHDDGTANDGTFGVNYVAQRRGEPGDYTIRITASAKGQVTAVDAEPFSIRTTPPVLPVAEIFHAVEIRWQSETGVFYQIYRSVKVDDNFQPFGAPILGTGESISVFDSTRSSGTSFYQVRIAE